MRWYSPIYLIKPRISRALTVSYSSFNVQALKYLCLVELAYDDYILGEHVLLWVYSHIGNTVADLFDLDAMNE